MQFEQADVPPIDAVLVEHAFGLCTARGGGARFDLGCYNVSHDSSIAKRALIHAMLLMWHGLKMPIMAFGAHCKSKLLSTYNCEVEHDKALHK